MEDAGISWNRDCSNRSCDWNTVAFCNGGKYSRKLSEGLRKEYGGMGNMQQGANGTCQSISVENPAKCAIWLDIFQIVW